LAFQNKTICKMISHIIDAAGKSCLSQSSCKSTGKKLKKSIDPCKSLWVKFNISNVTGQINCSRKAISEKYLLIVTGFAPVNISTYHFFL